MTTQLAKRRGGKGMHKKSPGIEQNVGRKRSTLPTYLEQAEIQALLKHAPNPQSKLIMMIQWRAGLRISEAIALERADVHFDGKPPTLHVRHGKGDKARLVPLHPELHNALAGALNFGAARSGRIVPVSRGTAWRWTKLALTTAIEHNEIPAGREVWTHTLRHSFARHCLEDGVPINVLSKWLGHANLATTLIYLEVMPDPLGYMERVT